MRRDRRVARPSAEAGARPQLRAGSGRQREPERRPRPGAGHELERPPVRLARSRATSQRPSPVEPAAARSAGERVESPGRCPDPSSDDVDDHRRGRRLRHGPTLVTACRGRQPLATRLASACRSRVGSPSTTRPGLRRRGDHRPRARIADRETADVDSLQPQRDEHRVGEEPLEVARRAGEREQAPAASHRPAARRGSASASAASAATGLRSSCASDARDGPRSSSASPLMPTLRDSATARRLGREHRIRRSSAYVSDERQRRPPPSGVPERDERVPAKPARVVPWARRGGRARSASASPSCVEPVRERDGGRRVAPERRPRAPLLDATVPRADVLADVAAVDAIPRAQPYVLRHRPPSSASSTRGNGSRRARPARRGPRSGRRRCRGVQLPQSGVERRGRLDLDVGDERSEHDPRAVARG